MDYNDLSHINCVFTDAYKTGTAVQNKVQELMKQVQSIGTTYNEYKKQAEQGKDANYTLEKMQSEGLSSAQYNVFSTRGTFLVDEHGALLQNYDDVKNIFSDEKCRLNGCNLIYTTNNWLSTEMALGKQKYTLDGIEYEEYGLNAKFALSPKIIGGDIYSTNYSSANKIGTHINLLDGSFSFGGDKFVYDATKDELSLKNGTFTSADIRGGHLLIGDEEKIGTYAEITSDGKLVAKSADITGRIISSDGIIGGWKLTSTDMYNDNSSQCAGIGKSGYSYAFWAGSSFANRNSAPFRVGHDGSLYASNANINGKITATSGLIGGWKISTNGDGAIYKDYEQYRAYIQPAASGSTWAFSAQEMKSDNTYYGNWYVTYDGYMRCNDGYLSTRNRSIDGKGIEISGNTINIYSWFDKDNYIGSIGSLRSPSDRNIISMYSDVGDELQLGYKVANDDSVYASISVNYDNNGGIKFYKQVTGLSLVDTLFSKNKGGASFVCGYADTAFRITNIENRRYDGVELSVYGASEIGYSLTVHGDIIGNLVSNSDRNVKKEISPLDKEKSSNFIYSLIPSEFKFKNGTSDRFHHGLIAQEVKESMGEDDWGLYVDRSVNEDEWETKVVDEKTGEATSELTAKLNLRYDELIADLIATIQSQNERIIHLEKSIQ